MSREEGPAVLPPRVFVAIAVAALAAASVVAAAGRASVTASAAGAVAGLHVAGNQIVNGSGQVVRPLGVNRSGTEYMCASGAAIFDGPSDGASVQAMAAWHINAVRVSLNEDCWLGINGLPAGGTTSGQYRQAIAGYVNLLHANGLLAILDLHWNAPGGTRATGQQIMPDLDHAPAFWTSVANTFKGDSSAIFDLYNEPHPQSWSCWRNGSSAAGAAPCADVGFAVAGMQTLVSAVRAAGAGNVLLLGGLAFSNDLSQWLANEPADPLHDVAAALHLYNFNACNNTACWSRTVAPVAARVPVVTGELGENDCAHGFIDGAMSFFDSHGIGYVGWAWLTASCGGFPSLITSYSGTPTNFGLGLKNHLAGLPAPSPGATPSPTSSTPPTPAPSPSPTARPTPSGTPTPAPAGSPGFSFEDGGADGWTGHGHVTSVLNSTATAHDGTHSLRVDAISSSTSDFPYASVAVSGASAPAPGQTVSVWVAAPAGSAGVRAKLFVQDSAFAWHMGAFVTLPRGAWTRLSLQVPPGVSVDQLGVQFGLTPAGAGGSLFVDSVSWP